MQKYDRLQGTNGKFFYILEDPSGAFEINSRTGVISIKNSALFDREKFEVLQVRLTTYFGPDPIKLCYADITHSDSLKGSCDLDHLIRVLSGKIKGVQDQLTLNMTLWA